MSTTITIDLTPALLAAAASGLISLCLSYIPGLNIKWDRLDPTAKRGIFALILIVLTGVAIGLSCLSIIGSVSCSKDGFVEAVLILLTCLWTSQTLFTLSPTPKAVEADRLARLGQG